MTLCQGASQCDAPYFMNIPGRITKMLTRSDAVGQICGGESTAVKGPWSERETWP